MRIELKDAGNKQAMNMKEATILKKYKELQAISAGETVADKSDSVAVESIVTQPKKKAPSIQIDITIMDKRFFDSIDFDVEWLNSIANRYNFNRFQYAAKFKAFRCYRGNNQLDWISVNDLAMLNGKQEITNIMLKHQPHTTKDKMIIKLPWRR